MGRRRKTWPLRNLPTRVIYSPSSPQLDFCTYNCGHCVFMCYVLWVTSSSSCIYTRWIWAASSASNTAELQLSLLASFTYNNIQNHSPLPNIHTQTIHAMLNSISFRAHLCTSGWAYILVFVCRTEGMGEVPPKKNEDVLRFTRLPRGLGLFW